MPELNVEQIVAIASEKGGSDIHLVAGISPRCRLDGRLTELVPGVLSHDDCEEYARQLAGHLYDSIKEKGELDLAVALAGRRVRVNLFRQQGNVSAALRILSEKIPEISALGLPKVVSQFPTYNKGIVLVTGETGSGKSTTLAAILDQINHTRYDHIITLEDPVEYVYTPDKCVINQREIGKDTDSYANGLRAILREDPDIILIGEMRDFATIETALTAAETGHLVFATLHTNSAVESIDRMVDVFPQERQQQIRMELSMTVNAILTQRLLVRASGHGRIAACEVMVATQAIRNLIREGKTPQMASAMLSSAKEGSITMDNSLLNMAAEGKITPQVALDQANDKEYVKKKMGMM